MEQNHIDPPYKVLIVDDSAIVRGLVARMLQDDSDIEVVGSVANGEDALAVMRDGGVEAGDCDAGHLESEYEYRIALVEHFFRLRFPAELAGDDDRSQ